NTPENNSHELLQDEISSKMLTRPILPAVFPELTLEDIGLRQTFKLPENSSEFVSGIQPKMTQYRRRTAGIYRQFTANKSSEDLNHTDRTKDLRNSAANYYRGWKQPFYIISRLRTLLAFALAGVPRPVELLSYLEKSGSGLLFIYNPDKPNGLDNPDYIYLAKYHAKDLAKIPNLLSIFPKLEKLNWDLSNFMISDESTVPDALVQLGNFSDKDFDRLITELRDFPFLTGLLNQGVYKNRFDETEIEPSDALLFIISLLEQGGVTPGQRDILIKAQYLYDLTNGINIPLPPEIFTVENERWLDDVLIIVETLYGESTLSEDRTKVQISNFLQNLLKDQVLLQNTANMIRLGITFGKEDLISINYSASYFDTIINRIKAAQEIFASSSLLNKLIILADLNRAPLTFDTLKELFTVARALPDIADVIKNMNQEEKVDLFTLINRGEASSVFFGIDVSLSKKVTGIKKAIARSLMLNANNGINLNLLPRLVDRGYLPEEDLLVLIPPEEQSFWRFVSGIDNLAVRSWLVVRKNQFNEFVVNGIVQDSLIDGLVDSGYSFYTIGLITEEVILNLPQGKGDFWKFVTAAPQNIQQVLIENRKRFGEFVNNGQITPAFVEFLYQLDQIDEADGYLTDEAMATFTSGQRQLFILVKGLPNEQKRFVVVNKDSFMKFFETGLWSGFYESLAKITEIDAAGAYLGKVSSILLGQNHPVRLQTPIGLTSWRVFRNEISDVTALTQDQFDQVIVKTKQEVEKRIRFVNALALPVPQGLRVSIGNEIEIVLNGIFRTGVVSKTDLIENEKARRLLSDQNLLEVDKMDFTREVAQIEVSNPTLAEKLVQAYVLVNRILGKIGEAKNKYIAQTNLTENLGVGYEHETTYEFANKPVEDYQVLLWELQELALLDFIDFDRELLEWIERGVHITISGEQGIRNSEDTQLLQNALLVTGWVSNAVDDEYLIEALDQVVAQGVKKHKDPDYIRERSAVKEAVFNDLRPTGAEFRAGEFNSFSHLARTLRNYHRLAIAIQAYQNNKMSFNSAELIRQVQIAISADNSLTDLLRDSSLLPEIDDTVNRQLIISWVYFREKSIVNFSQLQSSVVDYRLKSPLEDYKPNDINRIYV
ncbi:MAG: hypothetical protein AAB874_05930, partial [Patescibacteria group bacterium]